jgi:hypothetical protein
MNIFSRTPVITSLFVVVLLSMSYAVHAQETAVALDTAQKNAAVHSMSAGLAVRVAPGEMLPISVKLSNFGGGKRVDVQVNYLIISDKNSDETLGPKLKVYTATETIAVETTNSFVKTIQIPFDTSPGVYTAKTSILYKGQEVPATTEFSFRVERKILGLFQTQFYLYGGGMLLLSVSMVIIGYSIVRRHSSSRFTPIDYSNIPRDERVFYELISDTIMGMRQKVGDRALEIVASIDGIVIDEKTGRILKLSRTPSKIIAELVAGYEKTLGEKVSFSFRSS